MPILVFYHCAYYTCNQQGRILMKNKPQTKPQTKKENEYMQSVTASRPCTITDSITQSCQEVRKMRDGKIPEKSLDQLFSDIEQWCKEGGE